MLDLELASSQCLTLELAVGALLSFYVASGILRSIPVLGWQNRTAPNRGSPMKRGQPTAGGGWPPADAGG